MEEEKIHKMILDCVKRYSYENKINCGGVFSNANDAVIAAREAFKRYSSLKLRERQDIIEAIKQSVFLNVDKLAEMVVEETGMGNKDDKAEKIIWAIRKTPGIEDLITQARTDDDGMTMYELSPYGVVVCIHPITNPCATLINNTISALAAGNTVIHCPHPRASKVSKYLTEIIAEAILDRCGIDNMVVTVDTPSLSTTKEIMNHPDVALVSVTGGLEVMREAMTCFKKVIGGGGANPVAIVDETANLAKAARDIVNGASFDNNLMCTSEKNIVVVKSVSREFINELRKNDVYFINNMSDMLKLTALTVNKDLMQNKAYMGMSAKDILKEIGFKFTGNPRLIVVETIKQHPFVTNEMLMPIVPLVIVPDFEAALETALEIEQSFRHTATIHSQSIERLNIAAKVMQTSVFVKNAPSYAGIGFRSDRETSMTVASVTGEGTVTARHFARTRRCVLSGGFSIR